MSANRPAEAATMRITYFGHSCFLVEAQDNTRVIIDPYQHGAYDGAVGYDPVDEPADLVLMSHEHPDHAAADTIPGSPRSVLHPVSEQVAGVTVTGILVDHDETGGSERGKNTITILDDGDIRLIHLGDLGHPLAADTIAQIGTVDVLLIPVGGFFTVGSKEAAGVVEALAPSMVIPMHFKTPKIGFPIDQPDAFLQTQKEVQHHPGSSIEVTKDSLPAERVTVVLAHAR
jgi:L-ascorbate metabolism protein UlaG (beta-lactamase superfamily)